MKITTPIINGVQAILAPMQDSNSTTIQVLVKAGSIYETRETNGLSHFLEHMFFKGGKKYSSPKIVAETIDSFGGESNAFTGQEYAGYYVKCAPDYIETSLDVLSDMLVHSTFPEAELEREKGVVVQEIAMYEDNPQRQVWKRQNLWYNGDNPYGRPILGPKENVLGFTQQNLFDHKQQLYTKDNLVVIVAGKIPDENSLQDSIGELFGTLPESTTGKVPTFENIKPDTHSDFYEKGTQQNHLIISAPGFDNYDPKRYIAKIFAKVLGGGMSSRLFQRIREQKGLCYYIGGTHSADETDGNFLIYAGMDKANRDHGLESIYQELQTVSEGDVTQQEFDKALGSIRGSTQMGIETSDQLADFVGYQFLFKKEIKSLEEILQEYEKVGLEDVNDIGKMLVKDKLRSYWIQ